MGRRVFSCRCEITLKLDLRNFAYLINVYVNLIKDVLGGSYGIYHVIIVIVIIIVIIIIKHINHQENQIVLYWIVLYHHRQHRGLILKDM